MTDINLLARRESKISLQKVNAVSKTLVLFFGFLFFVLSLAVVFLIIYNQSSINTLREQNNKLQADVKSLSEVEAKYYFIRDRASKLNDILESRDSLKRLDDIKSFSDIVSSGNLGKVDIDDRGVSLSFTTGSYDEVRNLISAIKQNQNYKEVLLESLSFSATNGYTVEVSLSI